MKAQQGFGLIEVMLAFVLVSLMAASLLQLSKRYLEYSRDGRHREVALRLAESKLDELRHLAYLNQAALITGGQSSLTLAQARFELSWTAHALHWSRAQQAWQATANPVSPGKIDVSVTVIWHNAAGEPHRFELQSALVALPTLTAGPFGRRARVNH